MTRPPQPVRPRGPKLRATAAIAPLVIIGSLIYAAFFVKAEVKIDAIETPPIERRDMFYGISVPSPGVIWAVGSYGKVVRSEDNGQQWRIQTTPVTTHLQSISAWNDQQAVAVGNQGQVIVTADGGTTWTGVEVPQSEVANKLMKVRTVAPATAWAVGEMGAVLKSEDHGQSWARVLPEQDQAWNDVNFVGDAGWMVGEFGRIQRSSDGGQTWEPVESPTGSSLMSVHFRDAQHGVAVGLSGTVLSSDDGGASWTVIPPVTREHLNHVRWDGESWQAVGDKGVMVGNRGGTWQGGRLVSSDLSWRTQIEPMGAQLLLAGANLARLDQGSLQIFGRH